MTRGKVVACKNAPDSIVDTAFALVPPASLVHDAAVVVLAVGAVLSVQNIGTDVNVPFQLDLRAKERVGFGLVFESCPCRLPFLEQIAPHGDLLAFRLGELVKTFFGNGRFNGV